MEVVFMQKNLKTELYNNKVKLTPKTKNKCYFVLQIEKVAVSLYQQKGNKTTTNQLRVMKSETKKQKLVNYLIEKMFVNENEANNLVNKYWDSMSYLSKVSDMVRFIYA